VNDYSSNLHVFRTLRPLVSHVVCATLAAAVTACYSFRGGAIPEHLQTVSISSVTDKSGFGDASLREYCTETMLQRFRTDNTLQLVGENGDARLTPVLVRIQDQMLNVQSGDLEGQRRMVVAVEVEYVDAVKNRTVWKRTFENFDVYDVANATEDRSRAARVAIDRIVDDVLLAIVSDW
jgi:hypothetical protein